MLAVSDVITAAIISGVLAGLPLILVALLGRRLGQQNREQQNTLDASAVVTASTHALVNSQRTELLRMIRELRAGLGLPDLPDQEVLGIASDQGQAVDEAKILAALDVLKAREVARKIDEAHGEPEK